MKCHHFHRKTYCLVMLEWTDVIILPLTINDDFVHLDIPPLEDMTELIDQVNMLRKDVLPGRPIESSKIPTDPSTKKITESSSKVTTLCTSFLHSI